MSLSWLIDLCKDGRLLRGYFHGPLKYLIVSYQCHSSILESGTIESFHFYRSVLWLKRLWILHKRQWSAFEPRRKQDLNTDFGVRYVFPISQSKYAWVSNKKADSNFFVNNFTNNFVLWKTLSENPRSQSGWWTFPA